jgi:hypothetical protein
VCGSILQSAAQILQLVRAIQKGVHVDGDGGMDLNASRIYYYGHSLGAMYGMFGFAYEPAIRAAVFVGPAGTRAYNRLLSPATRPPLGRFLAARAPSLNNGADGLTSIDGMTVAGPFFNENVPLRNLPPRVTTIVGAIDIQRVVDHLAWAEQVSSTAAIAPLLRRSPPAGVRVRPFIISRRQWRWPSMVLSMSRIAASPPDRARCYGFHNSTSILGAGAEFTSRVYGPA